MDFICPKCKCEFALFDNGIKRCLNGHSFDRAKEGYYNFLLGKSGGTHGDNLEMVKARSAFLSLGYYLPLANRICDTVIPFANADTVLLDAGAGEGYYTDIVESRLRLAYGKSNVLAFDISKDAIKHLSKKNKSILSAVASSYDMPLAPCSVDVLMNVFSPLALAQTSRVLKKGGIFIMVFPGQRHLYDLKAAIYDTPYENKAEDSAILGFELIRNDRLDYKITLDKKEDIKALFMMTPYAYRTSESGRKKVSALEKITTEVSFNILTYKKI